MLYSCHIRIKLILGGEMETKKKKLDSLNDNKKERKDDRIK